MTLRAVAVSGSPRAPSKSKTLAELMLAALGHGGCETQMVDVAALPADALVARASAPAMDSAIAAIGEAQIVVAASPTYRALYTGVMKSFFDLMPHGHLAGKICVPIQTAGSPQHFLTIEYGMRPLFASLDGVPIAGVYATDDQFVEGQPAEKLRARIETVASAALALARAAAG
ncbi:MAG: NAD(P)H-dependent oxidoreductase [Chloroflexota bacterium]